jgi:hypothetical protein
LKLTPTGWAVAILTAGIIIAISMGVKAYMEEFIERNFIFFPTRPHTFAPKEWGLEADDVFFMTSDNVKLHAWHIRGSENAPLVLWFHGNAGNISDRVENAKFLADRGLALFMVDYRGYGKSEGTPSEKGIYIDGQSTYDYLAKQAGVAPENLIIFGRSLGSCVAVYVAANNPCAGVILESAFTNMAEMASANFSMIPGMGNFKRKFDSLGRIDKIRAPILFFHGDEDEIVPYALGQKLFAAATSEKEFYTIRGAHHNDTYYCGGEKYFDEFESFVRRKTGKKKTVQ